MSVYAWRYWCKECGWWDAEISAEDARWIMHRQRISPVLLDGESYPGQSICPSCGTPSTQTLPTQVLQDRKLSREIGDSERVSPKHVSEAMLNPEASVGPARCRKIKEGIETTMKALPAELDLQSVMESDSGLRIEVTRGMRAPIVNGQPTLKTCWRADCYSKPDKRWVFLITLVDDTLPGLYAQFGALSVEGKVHINHGNKKTVPSPVVEPKKAEGV